MSTEQSEFESAFKQATQEARASNQGSEDQTASSPAPAPEAAAPAPAPAEAAAPPADSASAASPVGQAPSPEDLQRQLQESIHRERSTAARISAVDRVNNQLKAQLAELQEKLNKLPAAAPAAPAPAPAADTKDVLDETPELSAAVQKRLKAVVEPLQQQLEEARRKAQAAEELAARATAEVKPLSETARKSQHEQVWNALDQSFTPKWREDIKGQDFAGWLDQQPKPIQQLYWAADTVADSAKVLNLYYVERGGLPPKPEASPAPAAAATANTERLRQAAGIPSRGSAKPSGAAADDFSGAFRQAFARIRNEANT